MWIMYGRDLSRKYWEKGYSMGSWLRNSITLVATKASSNSFVVLLLSIEFFLPFR